MSSDRRKSSEERTLARLKKAYLELTEEELQFFPKSNSMPDQPKTEWTQGEEPRASPTELNPDQARRFSFWRQ